MNVAIFGGTFDPIHRGHLAVAQAAQRRFRLDCIYFVPADVPPHKQERTVSSFYHRYAMVALATAGLPGLLPSLLEAPSSAGLRAPSYSVETVRRIRRTLAQRDRLFFLIGIDAFLEIGTWHKAEALLQEVEFIVVSRPGFALGQIMQALPESLRAETSVLRGKSSESGDAGAAKGRVVIHLLPEVREKVSATQLRVAAATGRSLGKLVPELVADYIRKAHLYRDEKQGQEAASNQRSKVVSIRNQRSNSKS
ncbi:MAG: nicotinate-nucleotide adenylyltransferase [Candidatus Korobacteraceae bacterium]